MYSVIYEFNVGKYTVLQIDPFPNIRFSSIMIDGVSYKVESAYDLKDCVAIVSPVNQSFLNKEVIFPKNHTDSN